MESIDASPSESSPPGRRAGVASLVLLALVPVAYLAAFGLGAILLRAFGLEEGEMLSEAGVAGVLAGVGLIVLGAVPQAIGIGLGWRARRSGALRLGLVGMIGNAVFILYFTVASGVGLFLG